MAFSTVWTARSTPAQYPRGLARSTRRRDCSAVALTMRCYVGRVSASGPPGTVDSDPEPRPEASHDARRGQLEPQPRTHRPRLAPGHPRGEPAAPVRAQHRPAGLE